MQKPSRLARADEVSFPFEKHITFRISVLSQLLSRVVDAAVSDELGLSSRQWRVLVTLGRLGPSTSGEIAKYSNFDKSQVSRVASELEEKGLLSQSGDQSDRRKVLLVLTKQGRETVAQGTPGAQDRQKRLLGRLSSTDYEVFEKVLFALTEEAQLMLSETKTLKVAKTR
jgi:DNA-binding MarR family transcriptional regulator